MQRDWQRGSWGRAPGGWFGGLRPPLGRAKPGKNQLGGPGERSVPRPPDYLEPHSGAGNFAFPVAKLSGATITLSFPCH